MFHVMLLQYWRHVVVIGSITTYGSNLAAAIISKAPDYFITVLNSTVVDVSHPANITAAVETAITSGARIFVFCGYDSEFLTVLAEGARQGIVGDAYAWITDDGSVTVYADGVTTADAQNLK
ncbi:hypothetical protein BDK51DRAFT_30079, partial [Blyttiomyces helicus]